MKRRIARRSHSSSQLIMCEHVASLVCHKYIQKKSTGDSSGFPFICGFLSCSLWLCYSHVTNDSSIHLVNVIGSTLFFLYTLVYYVFTVNKTALLKQFSLALLVLMLCLVYIHATDNVADAKVAVGNYTQSDRCT